ncbi:hypothetical protein [Parasitella parasitica]|uniref:Lysophospholipase n=1 Tax=Parasitella parasitica TaxID=35722 RepID=A0A0B7N3S8_9FUNG|nr:hypothetical protein [Parasitella parasitica]
MNNNQASKNPLWSVPFLSQSSDRGEETKKQEDDNAFIASLMSNKVWLSNKMDWPEFLSVDAINAKISELYPQFSSQFTNLREGYERMWDYLTMEDFRKIVEQVKKEESDTSVYPEMARDAAVREGAALSDQEKEFISRRKQKQKRAFAEFIGEDAASIDERDIPIVGIASSGGGYRAMIGLTGYLDAMKKSGVLDCTMYFTGISGSCWAMSLYYNNCLTNADPVRMKEHFQSRLSTHWANISNFINILTASPEKSKLLLQGAIQRYSQQHGDLSLVDIFGMLMGGTLLTKKTTPPIKEPGNQEGLKQQVKDDNAMEQVDTKRAMHLTEQAVFLEDGSEPLPIYCVVRHDIAYGKTFEERIKELKKMASRNTQEKKELDTLQKKADEFADEQHNDAYQWFEFTPYEMGSEEIEAWIPMWAFGRRFEHGKNLERLPEQTLDILMGMFGSAFAASLVHFYQEIRSFLPSGSLIKIDEAITRYESSMSSYHPISPSSFPNPFYKLSSTYTIQGENKEIKRPEALVDSKELYLMDAGMDNNIPFYPLMRQGRDVDVILAIDLSADIQTATHFDRAESYIKRRGIQGWPTGAGWPKERDNSSEKYPLGSCTIFDSEAQEQVTTTSNTTHTRKHQPITLAYFPFIVNKAFDAEFDPQEEEFCSTWNFVYTPEEVKKVTGLAEANWNDNIEKIRQMLRKTWERKRKERLQEE